MRVHRQQQCGGGINRLRAHPYTKEEETDIEKKTKISAMEICHFHRVYSNIMYKI